MNNIITFDHKRRTRDQAETPRRAKDLGEVVAVPGVDIDYQFELVRVLRLLGDRHILDDFNQVTAEAAP